MGEFGIEGRTGFRAAPSLLEADDNRALGHAHMGQFTADGLFRLTAVNRAARFASGLRSRETRLPSVRRGPVGVQAEGTIAGQRVRRSTRLPVGTDKRLLRERLREIETVAKTQSHRRGPTFQAVAESYLHRPGGPLHTSTVNTVKRWQKALAGLALDEVTPETIQFAMKIDMADCAPQSVQKYQRILRAILGHAKDMRMIRELPVMRIGRTTKTRIDYLSEEEAKALLERAWYKHPRRWASASSPCTAAGAWRNPGADPR
jgi:hypothetical protein